MSMAFAMFDKIIDIRLSFALPVRLLVMHFAVGLSYISALDCEPMMLQPAQK